MKTYENIYYRKGSTHRKHLLDVYTPQESGIYPVLIFVHGGSWYQGCKEWYQQLGQHFAHKKTVCVVINYRLGNETTYEGMAEDLSQAVKWTYEHIENYQGDPHKIFIGGHSAGGHLSALVSLNQRFLRAAGIVNPLKGCILIDAFGLNMDYIMPNNHTYLVNEMKKVFTTDAELWKDAAPVKFIDHETIPFLILTGTNSYPPLIMDNEVFKMNLEAYKVPHLSKAIKGRDHMEMITDFKDPSHPVYEEIIHFINGHSAHQQAMAS